MALAVIQCALKSNNLGVSGVSIEAGEGRFGL
mgnify:CR=1 FL=1